MLASQRKTLSIYDQLELIDDVKVKKLKLATAAKKDGIGHSTAAKILKKEDVLRSCMQLNGNTNRKRKRQSVHKDVNVRLHNGLRKHVLMELPSPITSLGRKHHNWP